MTDQTRRALDHIYRNPGCTAINTIPPAIISEIVKQRWIMCDRLPGLYLTDAGIEELRLREERK